MKKVFVFGSNVSGRHGAGAALYAREHHGATYGKGEGPQGNSYAIPTKDGRLKPLPLYRIRHYVVKFLNYARANPETQFQVTAIGTGLAGYTHKQIAPMFHWAPANCELPVEWVEIIAGRK